MSGEGMIAAARVWDSRGHRHGRWVGLFKLSEECGELIDAVAAFMQGETETMASVTDEIGDVRAAMHHAIEANDLSLARIEARIGRGLAWIDMTKSDGVGVMRRAGQLVQLLGKIAAFPDGDEHPDGEGNLPGRLEVALADLKVAIDVMVNAWRLDNAAIEERGFVKLRLFRRWFPAQDAAA